jgi:proline iminopeptidase
MTRKAPLAAAVILIVSLIPSACAEEAAGLFPVSEPLASGHLQVSELHKVFYATFGNPEGKPVMCLHGGPGVGSYPRLAQYFNPEKFYIVLHDQRGSGRSTPSGELRENTTAHLVEDVERLRQHLELGKVVIFGGSWGSTLALAYAESYPEMVTAMVLRGIFLGTEAELEYHYLGNRFFFPEEHHNLVSVLPDPGRGVHPDYLYELITGADRELSRKVQGALNRYELKFMKLHMPDETVEAILSSFTEDKASQATHIDLHYVANRYFMEDNQILEGIDKLKDTPVTLINGRYDMAAPPLSAFQVHQKLPRSKLIIVEKAGHSESEEGITAALLAAVAELE